MTEDLFDVGSDGAALLRVHVQPGAGRTAVTGRHGTSLKVRVAAPPAGGRANEAAAALLAETLGVKAADVTITGGESSRSKRFRIAGIEPDDLARRLAQAIEDAGGGPGRGDLHRDSRR